MTIILQHNFYKHKRDFQVEIYYDVEEVELENQVKEHNGLWLVLRGKGIEVNDGELYIDFDPKADYFQIRK